MGKTLDVVKELENLFSDRYNRKEKLRRLVRNIEYVKRLFTKLSSVIVKYNNIDEHKNFLNQLLAFKSLVEEHVEKATQHHNIILIIDDYIAAIREDYKIIRNYVQTLEDINAKIDKKVSKKMDKDKIGQLIIRAVEDKMPNFICSDPNRSASNERKLNVVKEFYSHFIKYISCVRESLENTFDDNKYRYKLENLQSKLLNTEPIDMDDYFSKVLHKITDNRGYSTEILLKNLAENPMVHISVSNKSSIYCGKFIDLFRKLAQPGVKSSDKKCIEPLSTLMFQLDENTYKELHVEIFKDPALIDLLWKSIYDKGIHLYLNGPTITRIDNFRPRSVKHVDMIKRKFSCVFSLILSNYPNLLNKLQQSIIDEKNASGTYQLLTEVYGQRVRNIDFSADMVDVRYCFNYYYFESLTHEDLEDVPGFPIFCRLLFYIHVSDDNIGTTQTTNDIETKKNTYAKQIERLKIGFLRVYNEHNHKHLKDLVEVLKIMINIQDFQFRCECTTLILSRLDADENSKLKLNVKVEMLKMFFAKCDKKGEICLRLAQSFNIHLLRDVITDDAAVLRELCEFNWYFKLFNKKLKDLKHTFDVNTDLTPGLSIPYYLSTKLLDGDDGDGNEIENDSEKKQENKEEMDEETLKTIMSILFKVFTCSSDTDKYEFLKNQNYIRKEFKNLSSSINQLIKFYDKNDPNEIYKELEEKSIDYILDGFSRTNGETLKEREQNARIIIDNFINYRLEHIEKIVKSSSKEEIFHTFDTVLKRRDADKLQEWVEKTSKLGDKIYFLYCYHKYSENEFDQWFRESNPNVTNICYDQVETKRISVKEEFQRNMKAFESINIKYLQHNQVGALSLISDYLEDPEKNKDNLFIKIGTGQGKSLTIAETARKIIELNQVNNRRKQQIFIITCYDHLAKRDYENYLNYYKCFNITSMHCSRASSTKNFDGKDVIYLDLKTYFALIRSEAYKALTESTSIHLPDLTNAVLIMDEFDSLILDSDEILQTVCNFDLKRQVDVEDIKSEKDIKKLFDKKFFDEVNEKFIDEFEKKFPKVFKQWCDKILNDKRNEETNATIRTFQDGLGKNTTLADSFLIALAKTSKATFVHFYLDPRTFYSKFKQVIGFSGSITEGGMNKFKTLFQKKNSIYYEIPPFFGASNLKINRIFVNTPGKIIENQYDFLKALRDEIRKRHSEQPILIFADSDKKNIEDKSNYDGIYDMLMEAKDSFLQDSTILSINSENKINENIHKIGKSGTITLATRILGRGADIKVDKNIKKGLHLILTYYPKRENIYVQMLGRTARQDEKGSYSEIVRFKEKFDEVTEVSVVPRLQKLHDTAEYFYKHINDSKKTIGVTWPLFSCLIQYIYADDLIKSDLNSFIKEHIL